MFSFLRVSMKVPFLRPGESMQEKYAASLNRKKHEHFYTVQYEHEVYEDEVKRVWNAQEQSLSNPNEPIEEDEASQPIETKGKDVAMMSDDGTSIADSQYVRFSIFNFLIRLGAVFYDV